MKNLIVFLICVLACIVAIVAVSANTGQQISKNPTGEDAKNNLNGIERYNNAGAEREIVAALREPLADLNNTAAEIEKHNPSAFKSKTESGSY